MTALDALLNAAACELAIALNAASPPDHSHVDAAQLLPYVHAQAQYTLALALHRYTRSPFQPAELRTKPPRPPNQTRKETKP